MPTYEQPGWSPAPSPVFVSAHLRREVDLQKRVQAVLAEGERVLGMFAVTKVQPSLQFVVVTSRRVAAGWLANFDQAHGWDVDLPVEDVAGAEVTGFMDNVKLRLRAGGQVKVGNLWDGADEPELHAALAAAHLGADPEPSEPSEPSEPPGPTYDVWKP